MAVLVLVAMLVTCSEQWTRGQAGTDCSVLYTAHTVQYCTVQYSTVQLIKQLSQPQAFQAGLKGFPTHYTILEVNVSYSWYILLSCAKVPLGSTDLQQTVTNLFGFG